MCIYLVLAGESRSEDNGEMCFMSSKIVLFLLG